MAEINSFEHQEVVFEHARMVRQRLPRNVRGYGCATFVVGALMLFALPVLLADPAVRAGSKQATAILTIALLGMGGGLLVFGNRRKRFRRAQAEMAAVALQRFALLTPEERRLAAIRLLLYGPDCGSPQGLRGLGVEAPDALAYVQYVKAIVGAEPERTPRNAASAKP
jgi:hypothetical protein